MISFLSHYHNEKSTDRGLPGETIPWGEILRPQNTGWVGASTSERASFLPSFSFLHATLFLLTSSLPELVRIASLTMFPFFSRAAGARLLAAVSSRRGGHASAPDVRVL